MTKENPNSSNLLEELTDRSANSRWRRNAAAMLAKLGDGKMLRPLAVLLIDRADDKWVRLAALRTLRSLLAGSAKASSGTPDYTFVLDMLTSLAGDKGDDKQVRWDAIAALNISVYSKAVPTLAAIASDRKENMNVRFAAVHALGAYGDGQALETLMRIAAGKEEHTSVRYAAAWDLASQSNYGTTVSVEIEAINRLLVSILLDKGEPQRLRGSAAYHLSIQRYKEAFEPLLQVAEDTEERTKVRRDAIASLGHLRDEQALEPLVRLVRGDTEPIVLRTAAVRALGNLNTEAGFATLKSIALDQGEASAVRDEAFRTLSATRSPNALPALHALLNTANLDDERRTSIDSLIKYINRISHLESRS